MEPNATKQDERLPSSFHIKTAEKRPGAYAVFGLGFIANTVSIMLGGTRPTVPDEQLWLWMAWITAALCFAFYLVPTKLLSQVATMALIIAAGSRAVGAIGWNPQLWSRFGGGSIWTMLTIAFARIHVNRRSAAVE